MTNAIFSYDGFNASIYIHDDKIIIIGKGISKGIGETSIPISAVETLQLTPSRLHVNGYITLGIDKKAASDQAEAVSCSRLAKYTLVVKNKSDDEILKQIKAFIEEARKELTDDE
ncbi:MAG: hypothetical protein E7612_10430 [Ruminococcaceae bacterium]|nr:hypothetical protein [Oscillospiraceae bacterium]